jgi:maleylacetoacetate isomerase
LQVLTLYTLWRSSAAYRVRIALGIKGLKYQSATVNLAAGEQNQAAYRHENPQGLVPSINTGQGILSQSLAIIEYLDEVHPQPPLLPADPLARARVRAMALLVACDMHPLNNLRVMNYLRDPLGHDDAAVNTWYAHWIGAGFRSLEEEAARYATDDRYLFGGQLSMADITLVPQMYNARRFKCELASYPRLRAIDAHLQGLPAFAAAAPELQPDAPR